jgi:parallel beta-helix repeat protein
MLRDTALRLAGAPVGWIEEERMRRTRCLLRFGKAVALVGLLALLCGYPSGARAADCGGGVRCQCGDTVKQSTTLTADIGVCAGLGLRVRSGIVLNCANHAITGNGTSTASYGVLVDVATRAVVKNCRVTGFRKGIRVYRGQRNQILANESFANHDYGIELSGSVSNTVANNSVHDNRDEGVHVGAGSHDSAIRGNTVVNNKNENIYVLSSNRCQITDNTATKTDSAAIFLKHVHDSYVANNTVVNGRIHARGDAVDNTFEKNSLRGNGYFFEAYQDANGVWTFPHNNSVIGGKVENTTTCLRFAGAYDNLVDRLQLDDECQVTMWAVGGREPTGNVVHTLPLP